MPIKRIWHGWTTPENADKYQALLHDEVFPGIEAKRIPGYLRIELFRRDLEDEVEFITMMTFESLQNVIDFQGEDYARSYVAETAQKILKRWDQISAHYEAQTAGRRECHTHYLLSNRAAVARRRHPRHCAGGRKCNG